MISGVSKKMIVLALLGTVSVFAISSGAPEEHSGAPGEQNCTACHLGRVNSGTGKVTIEAVNAATYAIGQKMRIRVTIEDPNAMRWGFESTARAESNTSVSVGTIAPSDGNTQVSSIGNRQWVTHTSDGTRRGTRSPVTFEFDWTAPESDIGPIVFYVSANAANGNLQNTGDSIYTSNVRLLAGGTSPGAPLPSFTADNITEAYNGQKGIAAGTWVTINGTNLASGDATWSPSSAKALDTALGGVKVKVNNVDSPIASVSANKITFLVPAETPLGDVSVVVERDGQASPAVSVKSAELLPAIQGIADGSGKFYAVATPVGGLHLQFVSAKGWVLGKPETDSRAVRGALPGEDIELYAIGLGKTDGDYSTSKLVSSPLTLSGTVNVKFGGASVAASSVALIAPGVYAVRVKVPDSLSSGDVSLAIELNGVSSGDNVLLNISKP